MVNMQEKYIIQHIDGGYLHRTQDNKWIRVPEKERATVLPREKAENVYKHSIRSVMRSFWSIVAIEEPAETENIEKMTESLSFDWQSLSQTQQKLFSDLSQVDQEICDIQHYIEFFTLDAAKGYKAYRMLKERLIRRREIKDEMTRISFFLSSSASDFASGRIAQQIKAMDRRIYTPRVLEELFGDSPVKGSVA